jgi:hypothetical protein
MDPNSYFIFEQNNLSYNLNTQYDNMQNIQNILINYESLLAMYFFMLFYFGFLIILNTNPVINNSFKSDIEIFLDKYNLNDISDDIDETPINKNSFVMEYTPLGNVIMKYSEEEEGYEYWSNKTIPYVYLEVVSRKYVKFFNCKSKYIERKIIDKTIDKTTDLKQNDDNIQNPDIEPQNKVSQIFNSDVFVRRGVKNKDLNNKTKQNIINKQGNKFINKGKIYEFNMIPNLKNKEVENMKISYKNFKQRINNN